MRRRVWAVVRRDLTVAMGSKAVMLPALIVPAVLLIGMPLLAGLIPRFADAVTAGDAGAMLDLLPPEALAGLPADPGLQAALVLVTYVFAPFILIMPVMYVAVIAADAIAGEKERGTLEGLLLTPLSDREVLFAKLLAAWVPAVTLSVAGAGLYALVANLSVGLQVGRPVLPTVEFAVMALWLGPTLAAAALGAVLLVSVRAKSTQEAFQLGGVVVVPVVILIVSQATGALLLSRWVLAVSGVVAAAIAAGLVSLGSRTLSRTRLGARL